jgi:hypothetical protein
MRNSVLNNLIVLLLLIFSVSCGKNLVPEGSVANYTEEKYLRIIPRDTNVIYKTAVNAYGKYLSGLLVVKSQGVNDYRLVFMTEMGVKLFDFEFAGDDFKVHHCIEQMNKKPVLKLLEKDFTLMLGRNLPASQVLTDPAKDKETGGETIFYSRDKEVVYYTYDKQSRQVSSIKSFSHKGKEKLFITFGRNGEVVPAEITLDHHNLDLDMKLDLLKK